MDHLPLKMTYGDHRMTVETRSDEALLGFSVHIYCPVCESHALTRVTRWELNLNPTGVEDLVNSVLQTFKKLYPVSCNDAIAKQIHDS